MVQGLAKSTVAASVSSADVNKNTVPSFLPSFLPSLLPSFLPALPPYFLPSFPPSFLSFLAVASCLAFFRPGALKPKITKTKKNNTKTEPPPTGQGHFKLFSRKKAPEELRALCAFSKRRAPSLCLLEASEKLLHQTLGRLDAAADLPMASHRAVPCPTGSDGPVCS